MKPYVLEVVQSVDFDVAEHRAFLETRRIGLGDQLLEEIRAVFAQLKENPMIFFFGDGADKTALAEGRKWYARSRRAYNRRGADNRLIR